LQLQKKAYGACLPRPYEVILATTREDALPKLEPKLPLQVVRKKGHRSARYGSTVAQNIQRGSSEPGRVNVLGVGVSAINLAQALNAIEGWIAQRQPYYVCVTGVHGIMESRVNDSLRRVHNAAGLVTPDGMPLVWLARLHGLNHVERVYGPDLMLALCDRSILKGYRHFLYGGAQGVPERLANRLKRRYPELQIVGSYSPPFRPLTDEEDEQIVQAINEANPDVVWIGLSTPKQEHWMAEHLGRLTAPVLIGVGAAFDFHSGLKKQAPRWMQRSGLEWLFRLASEPERLWRRYLVNNPLFVLLVLQQALGLKHYPDN
jgi:N-acetylglucosaminyldiphosphoundecaprenol N-acetyl-beta-D-mannosaminyltransferase